MNQADLQEKIGVLLEQQITLAHGIGGLLPGDVLNTITALAEAYRLFSEVSESENYE